MAQWEYCRVLLDPGYSTWVTYYRASGVKGEKLAFDKAMKADYEQWKRETGNKHGSKWQYVRDQLVCQLLADGWEWWQSAPYLWQTNWPVFQDIFRRQTE